MSKNCKQSRWRFSVTTLIVVVFVLCAFCAANLTRGKPQVMFRFSEEDGGGYLSEYGAGPDSDNN